MAVGEVSGGFTPSTGIAQLFRYGKPGVLDCGTVSHGVLTNIRR